MSDTPTIDFASVKDAIVEGWNLSLDLLSSLVMPDLDLTFDEEEDF
jgi:hypothetical protein